MVWKTGLALQEKDPGCQRTLTPAQRMLQSGKETKAGKMYVGLIIFV